MCKCSSMKPKTANTNNAGGKPSNDDIKKKFEEIMQLVKDTKVTA